MCVRVRPQFKLGEYEWRTYAQVEREARQFGAGLRALGCAPRRNVVMFAETRAEWMLAAHGCFTQTIPGRCRRLLLLRPCISVT